MTEEENPNGMGDTCTFKHMLSLDETLKKLEDALIGFNDAVEKICIQKEKEEKERD